MARVLVAAMPFAGHVAPMAALAAELVRRGHETVASTGSRYADAFARSGAAVLPWTRRPTSTTTTCPPPSRR